jgi:hypothetical protein
LFSQSGTFGTTFAINDTAAALAVPRRAQLEPDG